MFVVCTHQLLAAIIMDISCEGLNYIARCFFIFVRVDLRELQLSFSIFVAINVDLLQGYIFCCLGIFECCNTSNDLQPV